jgi:hypothetical protein
MTVPHAPTAGVLPSTYESPAIVARQPIEGLLTTAASDKQVDAS